MKDILIEKANREVIEYVKVHSKHPRAADIVTALLGNTDINPEWFTKPAYRVYLYKGETYTADRINGKEYQTLTADKYLTDWVEYDAKQSGE